MPKQVFCGVAVLLFALAGLPGRGLAEFPDRNITFIIPYSTGGGFDTYVRAIIPAMEKYLPNKVAVVPRNVSGAGGRKGAAAIYRARPDGYTIGVFNVPGMLLPQLRGDRVGYDLARMSWLGTISENRYALAVAGKSPIKTIADLKALNRPVKLTTTGVGSTAYAVSRIAADLLGLKARLITGYKGSKNYIMAAARGDGDAAIGVASTLAKYARGGYVKVIASFEKTNSFAGTQDAIALGRPELTRFVLLRMVGGPPGMPKRVRAVLAGALAKALADPKVRAWSRQTKRPLSPLSATETGRRLAGQMDFYARYKASLGKQ